MAAIGGWTKHIPAPRDERQAAAVKSGVALTAQCLHCTQLVRPMWRLRIDQPPHWVHVKNAPHDGWNVNDAKELYESLDTVWGALDDNTLSEFMNVLGTICGWSHNPEMWNTIRRWIDHKTEE